MNDAPLWEVIADRLEELAAGPTSEQARVADAIGVTLPARVPAPVAAVVLRHALSEALLEGLPDGDEVPETLVELESELSLRDREDLVTGSRAEVSAWFAARYMVLTARGLRDVRPHPGDVVRCSGWRPDENRVISSIGPDGRVYMKGRPPRKAWPNHLEVVQRVGDQGYGESIKAIEAGLRNRAAYTSNSVELDALQPYALSSHLPSPEAIRALEELLESGTSDEEPFQTLLAEHPALLATTVVGSWKTYVIPKQRLGSEYVTDFLVMGMGSVGPQWVAIELEAPRHEILIKDGSLSGATRHGVKQVQDWREWLTKNVAYAQNELHLYGITNQAPGLVIIGRDDPKVERDASRAQSNEGPRIAIHSWDWVLRHARNLSESPLRVSEFARENISESAERDILEFDEAEAVLDLDDLL